MDKVSKSPKNITAFGGLNFIFKAINNFDLPTFLDKEIGYRNIRAKFSYSDIVLSLFGNALCNGSYISDLEIFKSKFQNQFFSNIPSPDTIEYACQELKTQTIIEKTITDVEHEINYNSKLNKTLIALCVKTNQLVSGNNNYILDFDNVVIENDKQDAKKSYKNTKGYHPNFAFIGRLPVHIENHNGNTPAKYQQKQTLERCFKNLKNNNINIEHFRADSASYQKEVIELVEKNSTNFYIRNISSDSFSKHCNRHYSF
jgi:Transposase DDE domain group 1